MCASGHGSGPAAGREMVGSQVVHINMKSAHGHIGTYLSCIMRGCVVMRVVLPRMAEQQEMLTNRTQT